MKVTLLPLFQPSINDVILSTSRMRDCPSCRTFLHVCSPTPLLYSKYWKSWDLGERYETLRPVWQTSRYTQKLRISHQTVFIDVPYFYIRALGSPHPSLHIFHIVESNGCNLHETIFSQVVIKSVV